MKIELHMSFDGWDELQAWLDRDGRQIPLPLDAPPEAPPKPAPAPAKAPAKGKGARRARVSEPEAATAVPEPAPEPVPEPAPEPVPEAAPEPEATPTLDDAREALKALNDAAGMPACFEVLKEFSARRVSELQPEQMGPFIARCQAMHQPPRPPA
jgi:hypothetical protein